MEAIAIISMSAFGSESGGGHRRPCYGNEMAAAMQLKKILEWELSLDARDLRSHAWYHGSISRAKAEQIVNEQDGDFLVRDCTSQPGNYVLSCRSKGQNLHFVINKMVLQADTIYESVQYRFEDDGFDTVPDLITYYVGSGKPITVASAAKIHNPRNRQHPLSFYNADAAVKFQVPCFEARSQQITSATTGSITAVSKSPTARRRDSFVAVAVKQRSLSLRPGDFGAANAAGVIVAGSVGKQSRAENDQRADGSFSNSLPRSDRWTETGSRSSSTVPPNVRVKAAVSSAHADAKVSGGGWSVCACKDYANGCVDDCSGVVTEPPPPPKPSRHITVPEHSDQVAAAALLAPRPRPRKNSCFYATGNRDFGCGADESAPSSNTLAAATDVQKTTCGVVIKNPKYDDGDGDGRSSGRIILGDYDAAAAAATTTPRSNDDSSSDASKSYGVIRMNVHRPPSVSAFDVDAFHTLLLPAVENKPLDTCALQGVHMLLMDSGSRILANHLTRVDLELTVRDFGCSYDAIACKTGLELSLLPQGRRHRYDLIERTECLRLLVAVTILTCATESERAELLNKWIQVAIDTKTALGNLYGFCSIMLGLCTPQVLRLNETWHILRQRYTDSAFNFEAKLRPTLKCMNESTNPLAPNTTIPHLLPVILLRDTNCWHNSDNCGIDVGDDEDEEQNQDQDQRQDDDDDGNAYHMFTTNSHLWDVCINQWEACSPDLGLGTLYSHLNASRQFYNLLPTLRRNAEIVLNDSKIDHLLFDMFRTEFHMKFLWGSRGAKVNASERYSKFQQVLNVMSEKCETIDCDDAGAGASAGTGSDTDTEFAFFQSAGGSWYNNSTSDGGGSTSD